MTKRILPELALQEIRRFLKQQESASAAEICARIGISQAAFSRLASLLGDDELLRIGKARAARYSLLRPLSGGARSFPVYEIGGNGRSRLCGHLFGVHPDGHYFDSKVPEIQSRVFAGIPYFLDDLRPAGFLGQQIPVRHPELELPQDTRTWSHEHVLRYLTRFGWDGVGSYIVGDDAFGLYLEHAARTPEAIASSKRAQRYPELAADPLSRQTPGSSAGGEQPKFLTTRKNPGGALTRVLVKFSPPTKSEIARRSADLLICEALALRVLTDHGVAAARGEIIEAGDRVFLELERFDREGTSGRHALLSLAALDSEWVGDANGTWSSIAHALQKQKRIAPETVQRIRSLELFGRYIGNTDMHAGNLSFFCRGERLLDLTPVYDMLPMLYAPAHQQLIERPFAPAPPKAADADVWQEPWRWAMEFWARVSRDTRISDEMRERARGNREQLAGWEALRGLLPGAGGDG